MNDSHLLQEADRCVKCGICLPHCPTYKLTLDEGDSPRGRIALIQGIIEGRLESGRAEEHVARCLGCLACEAACPSQVRYGSLLDGYRATRPPPRSQRLVQYLISHLPYTSWAGIALWIYRFSGIRFLTRRLGGHRFRRIDNLMPPGARLQRWPVNNYPGSAPQGRVALFTGCVGRITDQTALEAAIAVLTRLGYEVAIPLEQHCCGAMHQHAGSLDRAAALAEKNRHAFPASKYDALIYLASGCGAQLVKQQYEIPTLEISQFLNQCQWPAGTSLGTLEQTVAVHIPCTLKHQLKLDNHTHQLLQRIPGIKLQQLDEIDCCGAAGSYLLQQPAMADRLLQQAMELTLSMQPDIITTSNTGCALQLASGVRQGGHNIRVMHPVELVLESLCSGAISG